MLSAHAGIVFLVSTKEADAAEVQGARICAASGCFINFQVKSGKKLRFFFFLP